MYYIGQHKTRNPTDTYMGSGHYIERAIKKHSHGNFIKEILFDFDNFEDMNNKEKELVPVNECFPNNPMFGYHWSEEQRKHQSEVMKGRTVSDEFREKCRIRCTGSGNPMYGKHHTDEAKKKISDAVIQSGRCAGENNPMYNLKNMTEEQKIQWRRKIGQGNKGKKRTDEDRKKMSEWVKSHPYRRMHHQITKKIANVPIEKVQ